MNITTLHTSYLTVWSDLDKVNAILLEIPLQHQLLPEVRDVLVNIEIEK